MKQDDFDLPIIDSTEDFWWVFYLQVPITIEKAVPLLGELKLRGLEVIYTDSSPPYFKVRLRETSTGAQFELSNPSDDVAPYVFFGTQGDSFVPPDSSNARACADDFLEYGKLCYRFLHPLYAFAENMNAFVGREDLENGHLTHVFWGQLFSSRYVEKLGKKLLMNAPGWRNENLGDGGLLYTLAASPYLYRGSRQYWTAARLYFERYLPDWKLQWSDMPI